MMLLSGVVRCTTIVWFNLPYRLVLMRKVVNVWFNLQDLTSGYANAPYDFDS